MTLVLMKSLTAIACLVLLTLGLTPTSTPAAATTTEPDSTVDELWYPELGGSERGVSFYFVFSETCPHCTEAKPFVAHLEDTYDWLLVSRIQYPGGHGRRNR